MRVPALVALLAEGAPDAVAALLPAPDAGDRRPGSARATTAPATAGRR